jgi:hypothetical protein
LPWQEQGKSILQLTEEATTFVLSNESGGYLIDELIKAGYGNSSLYDTLVALQGTSGGVISDAFLATLAACPAGSEIFTASLSNFAGLNNPVCINSDGTLSNTGYFPEETIIKKKAMQPTVTHSRELAVNYLPTQQVHSIILMQVPAEHLTVAE